MPNLPALRDQKEMVARSYNPDVSLRFRRTVKLLPGVRLNLGLHGAGLSVGPRAYMWESTAAGCTRELASLGVAFTPCAISAARRRIQPLRERLAACGGPPDRRHGYHKWSRSPVSCRSSPYRFPLPFCRLSHPFLAAAARPSSSASPRRSQAAAAVVSPLLVSGGACQTCNTIGDQDNRLSSKRGADELSSPPAAPAESYRHRRFVGLARFNQISTFRTIRALAAIRRNSSRTASRSERINGPRMMPRAPNARVPPIIDSAIVSECR